MNIAYAKNIDYRPGGTYLTPNTREGSYATWVTRTCRRSGKGASRELQTRDSAIELTLITPFTQSPRRGKGRGIVYVRGATGGIPHRHLKKE